VVSGEGVGHGARLEAEPAHLGVGQHTGTLMLVLTPIPSSLAVLVQPLPLGLVLGAPSPT
jgi:hypothetical protein